MSQSPVEDKDFKGVDFSIVDLAKGGYENCTFIQCIFTKSALTGIRFIDCLFEQCDFSLAKFGDTAFRGVKFVGCKMLGLHFEHCSSFLLSMDFDNCQLNVSSFYQVKMNDHSFKNCSLREVDFTEADLTGASFDNCDLKGANFEKTILEKADFRIALNYSIDPENNRMKKAKFSRTGITGLLDKYDLEIE